MGACESSSYTWRDDYRQKDAQEKINEKWKQIQQRLGQGVTVQTSHGTDALAGPSSQDLRIVQKESSASFQSTRKNLN